MPREQPTLTDGVVTLRPWRDDDIAEAVAGHDEEIALWFGWDPADVSVERHRAYAFQWFALCALVAGLYLWFQIIQPRRQRARLPGPDAR